MPLAERERREQRRKKREGEKAARQEDRQLALISRQVARKLSSPWLAQRGKLLLAPLARATTN